MALHLSVSGQEVHVLELLIVRNRCKGLAVDVIAPRSIGSADPRAEAGGLATFAAKFGRIELILIDGDF